MIVVQCARCYRVCNKTDFGVIEEEDGCSMRSCIQCHCDEYYILDKNGKRARISANDTHVDPIPREFNSLKAYQSYLEEQS